MTTMADETKAAHPRETRFSSLSHTAFRTIWAATAISNFGGFIHITAAAWLMTSLTSSTTLIAMVQTSVALPMMFFALFAGATADVFDKRRQMVGSLVLSATSVFTLFILLRFDLVSPWSLLILTGMIGVGGAFYGPAWQSSLLDLVPRADLVSAVSLNNLSMNVARCLGPAIAAEMLIRLGASAAFFMNGVSFLFLIGAIFLWRGAPKERSLPRENLIRAIGDGFRYMAIAPEMQSTLLRSFIFALGGSALLALPPAVAISLGGGARTLGMLLVAFGLGAMSGALSLARVRALMSVNTLSLTSALVTATTLAVFGLSKSILISAFALVCAGFVWVQLISSLQISIQTASPRWVVGRMVSLLTMCFSGGIALGSVFWGAVADSFGLTTSIVSSAIFMGIAGLLMQLVPFNPPREEDLEPLPANAEINLPTLQPKSGPVLISIEYQVACDKSLAFLHAAQDLRRIRLRDGARRWSLSQDISDNSKWVEHFESPTWADYQHRVSRRLAGDVPIIEAVHRLCLSPPIWSRRLERRASAQPLDIAWPGTDD